MRAEAWQVRYDTDSVMDGFIHRADGDSARAIVLAHGAGSDCNAPLLVQVASALADAGTTAIRLNLPFRQLRPHGPPFPAMAEKDRLGLRSAVLDTKRLGFGAVFLGGHSYGGRQATVLAANEAGLAEALLLLSYPLHPPRKLNELRTAHFPKLTTPSLFVHGSRDPFGSPEEMRQALQLIPSSNLLHVLEGAGHDLAIRKRRPNQMGSIGDEITRVFLDFAGSARTPGAA